MKLTQGATALTQGAMSSIQGASLHNSPPALFISLIT